MSFSIRRIIRALVAPDCKVLCTRTRWLEILRELDRRGERRHEAGAFLLGHRVNGVGHVIDVVYYDDLDPSAYQTGVCVLRAASFQKLWAICRERAVELIADVHTHPGKAFQSEADRLNPMVARVGHTAIIVPDYASRVPSPRETGVFIYAGSHRWQHVGHGRSNHFYAGRWS